MRLSDFCNRPTTRAPCTLPDSRSRSPARCAVLRPRNVPAHADPPSTTGSGLRPLQHPMTNHQVELRLTATLQLQLRHNPPGRTPRSRSPDSPAWFEHRAFLGKLRSKAPPRRASRPRLCRPQTEHAAWPLTSSVATAPSSSTFRPHPRRPPPGPASTAASSKSDRFAGTRTPSIDDCSPTSAIRTTHEHNHEPSDPGSTSPTWLAQLALDRRGWGPIRRIDRRIRMTPVLPLPHDPRGPR